MKRGAQRGNNNATKSKDWEGALKRVLATLELKDKATGEVTIARGEALRKIAETCVMQALAGDKDARQEIANRVDGKPTEHVQVEQNVTFNVGDTTGLETRLDGVLSRRTSDPLREKPPH